MGTLVKILLFFIAVGLLVVFSVCTYGNPLLKDQTWWCISWPILSVCGVAFFCVTTWFLLEDLNNGAKRAVKLQKISEEKRDVHLQRLDHVDAEVTRYRDLSWKIAGLNWAIYFAIDRTFKEYTHWPKELYFIFLFLAAGVGTIFLLFCELSAHRNRIQRRELGIALRLIKRWNFTKRGTNLCRVGFWFSVGVFILAVWAPPLTMLFFRLK